MEWLLAHADDASLDDPFTEEEAGEMKKELEAPPEPEKKPLTEEEKAEKLARLEELRIKKRAERLEKEKQEVFFSKVIIQINLVYKAKEKEKKRIESGKDMGEIRQNLAEQEIKKLADLRRREKEEEKKAKARVLAQIEADKAARRAEKESAKAGAAAAPAAPPVAAAPPAQAAVKKDYTEARLQIRQTNGQALVHSFGVKEPLAAVRLYVEMNRLVHIYLFTINNVMYVERMEQVDPLNS